VIGRIGDDRIDRRVTAKLAGISYTSFCRKVSLLRLRVRVTVEH
jgi:hypothetical protein